ncbi:MAG: AAA family ATPase [Nitrospirae bacterium]|nr:MAG: AAA family ATPase [Nitrospirota bacterium]
MARSDLILQLIRAALTGDRALVRKTAESLAADERAKNHTIFADRILSQLETQNAPLATTFQSPAVHRMGPFWTELAPKRKLSDLVLPEHITSSVRELVEEHHHAELLRSHGLEPRHRVLLSGPPGNGKTSLAEAIAHALRVPFLVVRYEMLIESYLGETARHLGQLFDHARSRPCVLFFDEFDVVAKERGDAHETGEIKRVVSALLLQVDALPSHVVVIAASNHPELLDRAVWRRFQLRLELPMPSREQIEEWIRRFQTRTQHELGLASETLAQHLAGASFADVEQFGLDALRRIVLAGSHADQQAIAKDCLDHLLILYRGSA